MLRSTCMLLIIGKESPTRSPMVSGWHGANGSVLESESNVLVSRPG